MVFEVLFAGLGSRGDGRGNNQAGRSPAGVQRLEGGESRFQTDGGLIDGQKTQGSCPGNRLRPVVDTEFAVDIALSSAGDPLSSQDAATAFLRTPVEVHVGSGLGAPPMVYPSAGSGRQRNADQLSRGRCVGSTRDAVELRTQTVCEGARRSVGEAGDRELAKAAFVLTFLSDDELPSVMPMRTCCRGVIDRHNTSISSWSCCT